MTNLQEDWYPDPDGTGRNRYFDGEQWTDRYSAPYEPVDRGLRAPNGTNPTTPWIWVLAFSPIVSSAVSIAFTVSRPIDSGTRNSIPSILVSAVIYLLLVLIAFRDTRELRDRGVPAPFGWGWAFLSVIVYVIGRSVVVNRRTGTGLKPLWAYIAAGVVALVASIVVSTAFTLSQINGG